MQNDACPSGLFSLHISEFESDQPGILNSPAAMLFGLPRRQCLPKSLPQLHIRHAAAQTRTVSAVLFRPNPRMLWRQFKWILFLTDTVVRVLPPQTDSVVSSAADFRVCGCIDGTRGHPACPGAIRDRDAALSAGRSGLLRRPAGRINSSCGLTSPAFS